jgi:hypothetical protein
MNKITVDLELAKKLNESRMNNPRKSIEYQKGYRDGFIEGQSKIQEWLSNHLKNHVYPVYQLTVEDTETLNQLLNEKGE